MSCPICSKPTRRDWRPFCSKRCADLDLGRWLNGGYTLPDTDIDAADQTPPEPGPDDTRH
ncbi:DNA gyrase inhibitor YacG [Pukyongiella litopenaei]|uniref:DNA gyrase inhibitor YacG n=1 Tax=Pukyongiella litopenaei TaxID=2605946 RepID=A0A2S0MSA0_9RHOB|nr:DNA gyrase inhibitor YacG [Pukyongiella litopenaei]AVO38778.1 DNA gyrase inhibitor YacG [Pukyongiella litopenaei]